MTECIRYLSTWMLFQIDWNIISKQSTAFLLKFLFLVEDKYSTYSDILLKCFVAEGVLSSNGILLASSFSNKANEILEVLFANLNFEFWIFIGDFSFREQLCFLKQKQNLISTLKYDIHNVLDVTCSIRRWNWQIKEYNRI